MAEAWEGLDPEKYSWFYKNQSKPSDYAVPKQFLFYGRWKSGKTWLGLTAHEVKKLSPVLVIDTEGSAVGTAANFPDADISIQQVNKSTNPAKNLNNFEVMIDLATSKDSPFKTVIIDTLDEAHRWKHTLIDEKWGEKSAYGKDWRELSDWTSEIVSKLRAADITTILITHQNVVELENGLEHAVPALSGKSREILPGLVDVIGHVERKLHRTPQGEGNVLKETKTTVRFLTTDGQASGSRFEKLLPASIDNPTMKKIYDSLDQNQKKSKTKEK